MADCLAELGSIFICGLPLVSLCCSSVGSFLVESLIGVSHLRDAC